jgi:hypothetical protein
VIEHGVTGVIVDDYRRMPAALDDADALEPLAIRRRAEERFAPERMVDDYLAAYRRVISGELPGPAADLPAEAAGIAEP